MNPTLILTPLNPVAGSYDPGLVASAHLNTYGGMTSSGTNFTLRNQFENDRVLLRQTKTWDNTLNMDTYYYRHTAARVQFNLNSNYWASDTQILVVLDIESASGPQDVQVFVGSSLVREQGIEGRENIAIILDYVPGGLIIVRPKTMYKSIYFYKASVFII